MKEELLHRLSASSAQRRMRFDGAYIREELPAAFALGVGADFDGGGEVGASGDVEVAEDEEFLEGGQILEDGVGEASIGEGELDGGFEVGADLFGLTGGFDGLLDDGAGFQQFFNGGGGLGAGER